MNFDYFEGKTLERYREANKASILKLSEASDTQIWPNTPHCKQKIVK